MKWEDIQEQAKQTADDLIIFNEKAVEVENMIDHYHEQRDKEIDKIRKKSAGKVKLIITANKYNSIKRKIKQLEADKEIIWSKLVNGGHQ